MARAFTKVPKEPDLAIALIHRSYLVASIVEVVVGELEHVLRPRG